MSIYQGFHHLLGQCTHARGPKRPFNQQAPFLDLLEICGLGRSAQVYALSQLEEEDDDLQSVIVGRNMHTFGRIVVGIAAGLKALSWQGLLATFPQVLSISSAFVSYFKTLEHV